jgi:H+/gluconate symporter-like permease
VLYLFLVCLLFAVPVFVFAGVLLLALMAYTTVKAYLTTRFAARHNVATAGNGLTARLQQS